MTFSPVIVYIYTEKLTILSPISSSINKPQQNYFNLKLKFFRYHTLLGYLIV